MARKPLTGPCVNAVLDTDGSVLVECAHGGTAPMIVASLNRDFAVTVRGMCDGCQADEDERRQAEDWRKRQVRLGQIAPPRMRDWSLDTVPDDQGGAAVKAKALEWLHGWRQGVRQNLILWGGIGGGKSGLAWSLARDVVEHDSFERGRGEDAQLEPLLDVDFVNFRDYLEGIKLSWDANVQADRRASQRKLLVLDDLGAERPTDFARTELASLVEYRYGQRLSTIVTSNYPLDELSRRLGHDDPIVGQRIVSRLAQDAVQIRVDAQDRRV